MSVMSNVRIQPHNERPAAVWSAGREDYDRISRGIADSIEHAVLRLNPQPGERILDLSTGTGWTSRVVARRGAIVTGVDIATGLLDVARAKANAEALPIDYQVGDAENLPFESGAFDAVVSTCGIMFASRPEAAAGELGRICRKGGRVVLTTWLLRQQSVQDVRGDETIHASGTKPGSAITVRMGPHRADPRAAWRRIRAAVREGRVVLPRPQRRGGVGYVLDWLWPDAIACRQPRP